MEKVVISLDELAESARPAGEPSNLPQKLPPPIQWWARLCLAPLVALLPLLCIVTFVVRILTRGLPPRNRFAWTSYLSTLLAISGLLTSIATVVALSIAPTPSVASQGLSELDSRTQFPALPSTPDLTTVQASEQLKPLVTVITPVQRFWFSRAENAGNSIGAGIILQANNEGYLIATARHVVDGELKQENKSRALVASTSGTWAGADVVARHKNLDLLLIWLPRRDGHADFALPVLASAQVKEGEPVFVIGHPQDLRFTLSTGIVSRKDQDIIQISAPVSPGNSGGPLFNARGELIGIITSMIDKNHSPNAENLNFAVCADALLQAGTWDFSGNGSKLFTNFLRTQHAPSR